MNGWTDAGSGSPPSRHDRMTLDRFDRLLGEAILVRTVLAVRLATIRESLAAWPPSRVYGEATGSVSAWCWKHQREVARCIAAGLSCSGDPTRGTGDPTGERAINRDPVEVDRRTIDRHVRTVAAALANLTVLLAAYEPREARDVDRLGTPNEPGCSSCARLSGRWEPITHPRTTVRGNLAEERALCWWCYRWTGEVGRLPTIKELATHHDGHRVYRPASRA